MGRLARAVVSLGVLAALSSCAGTRPASQVAGPTTTSGNAPAGVDAPSPTALVDPAPTSSSPAGSPRPPPSTTASPPGSRPPGTAAPGSTAVGAAVVEAAGWRLAVDAPRAGARVGRELNVCYQITGSSREPVLALEISATRTGTEAASGPRRVDVGVGRAGVRVRLEALAPGPYDLGVQLIVNGERVSGARVVIPVEIAAEAPTAACP